MFGQRQQKQQICNYTNPHKQFLPQIHSLTIEERQKRNNISGRYNQALPRRNIFYVQLQYYFGIHLQADARLSAHAWWRHLKKSGWKNGSRTSKPLAWTTCQTYIWSGDARRFTWHYFIETKTKKWWEPWSRWQIPFDAKLDEVS